MSVVEEVTPGAAPAPDTGETMLRLTTWSSNFPVPTNRVSALSAA